MRARQTSRQAGRPPAAILFANAAASAAGQFGVMVFGNEVSPADAERKTRRVLLAPYGDWPNQRGLQRFQKEDAQNIVNEFSSLAARVATPSSWLGIPWYEGHPDHPDFKGKPGHTRPVAVGRIKKLEAGNEGLWAEVRFNDDGERLISNESYHGHSVNWYMLPDAKDKRAYRPFSLKSVGFTNEPNIPVPAVTTANEAGGRELRFQHMAKLRAAGYGRSAANAGTSEGAKKGWASRASGYRSDVITAISNGHGWQAAKNHADKASKEAWSASAEAQGKDDSFQHQQEAASAHRHAAMAHQHVSDAAGHLESLAAKAHNEKADFHFKLMHKIVHSNSGIASAANAWSDAARAAALEARREHSNRLSSRASILSESARDLTKQSFGGGSDRHRAAARAHDAAREAAEAAQAAALDDDQPGAAQAHQTDALHHSFMAASHRQHAEDWDKSANRSQKMAELRRSSNVPRMKVPSWIPEKRDDIAGKEHLYKTARIKASGEVVSLHGHHDGTFEVKSQFGKEHYGWRELDSYNL